ncbi:MAG: 50S ribosomal protein L33 [Alphaproteobacteria bacterium]
MGRNAKTIFIKLESTGTYPEGHVKAGQKTGFYYTTKKNPKSENTVEKIRLSKYDPMLRKHVEFVEAKMKSGSGKGK